MSRGSSVLAGVAAWVARMVWLDAGAWRVSRSRKDLHSLQRGTDGWSSGLSALLANKLWLFSADISSLLLV